MFNLLRKFRRKKIVAKPFPVEWLEIIEKNIEYFQYLDQNKREALKNQVKVFVAEKEFEGASGLEITDEIRVTIAAQACLLTLGLKNDCYPLLDTVVVYPSAYQAKVVIVSPNTLYATLNTMRAVLRDAQMREQAGLIQKAVATLLTDVGRLATRVGNLQKHYALVEKDLREIQTSTHKIARQGEKIAEIDVEEDGPDLNVVTGGKA